MVRDFLFRSMTSCGMEIVEQTGMGPRAQVIQVEPRRDVQVAWLELLRRNRPAVVERYLERRCELSRPDSVRYTRSCIQSDGERLPQQRATLHCDSGRLDLEEGP